jgi:hypothetical protein
MKNEARAFLWVSVRSSAMRWRELVRPSNVITTSWEWGPITHSLGVNPAALA